MHLRYYLFPTKLTRRCFQKYDTPVFVIDIFLNGCSWGHEIFLYNVWISAFQSGRMLSPLSIDFRWAQVQKKQFVHLCIPKNWMYHSKWWLRALSSILPLSSHFWSHSFFFCLFAGIVFLPPLNSSPINSRGRLLHFSTRQDIAWFQLVHLEWRCLSHWQLHSWSWWAFPNVTWHGSNRLQWQICLKWNA